MSPKSYTVSCLAVSGSLRQESSNTSLLEAAAALVPEGMHISIYRSIGELPHFSPDLDPDNIPSVNTWAEQVRNSDGLIVSTPEYAHGLPGSLKNALDWLVGGDAFYNKPFMLLNASSRSAYARDSLVEILSTMSGVHIKEASTTIHLLGRDPDEYFSIIQRAHAEEIRTALALFAGSIREMRRA